MQQLMRLTKHHGLGNDFLVLIDLAGDHAVDESTARAVCDRRRGVGADGLILVSPSDRADVAMTLWNSDGSPAEMSGNGMRCLAQAVTRAGVVSRREFTVETKSGVRSVEIASDTATATVDMGQLGPCPVAPDALRHDHLQPAKVATASLGNPHIVLVVDDPKAVDLATVGPAYDRQAPGGANVEFIAAAGSNAIDMTVWERGAGITEACGTGACVAAHAANGWGLVGNPVDVNMPGGTARVDLGDTIKLSGPVHFVATIELDQ